MNKRELIKHIEALRDKTVRDFRSDYISGIKAQIKEGIEDELHEVLNVGRDFSVTPEENFNLDLLEIIEKLEDIDKMSKAVADAKGLHIDEYSRLSSYAKSLRHIYNNGVVNYIMKNSVETYKGTAMKKQDEKVAEIYEQFNRILSNMKKMPVKDVRIYLDDLGLMPKEEVAEVKNEVLAPVDMAVLSKYLK